MAYVKNVFLLFSLTLTASDFDDVYSMFTELDFMKIICGQGWDLCSCLRWVSHSELAYYGKNKVATREVRILMFLRVFILPDDAISFFLCFEFLALSSALSQLLVSEH